MVEPEPALELDDVAYWLARVDVAAVVELYARGVEGVGRRHLDAAYLGRAALLDRHGVLDPLPLQVGEDLEIRDRRGPRLPHQRLDIREMVEVAVGYQDGVELADVLQVVRGLGVLRKERIYDDLPASRRYKPERRVPEVGDPCSA